MKILIDNGHGADTPGKCSPDKRLREWQWNRDVAQRICRGLRRHGLDAELLVPGDDDIPLRERVRAANVKCRKERCLLISVHANAAGADGKWHAPHGWSVFVSRNASQASRELARCLRNQARLRNLDIRQPMPAQPYWEQNFAICHSTICPAVLTENLFMDNEADCKWMLSDQGKNTIAELHIGGVLDFLQLQSA